MCLPLLPPSACHPSRHPANSLNQPKAKARGPVGRREASPWAQPGWRAAEWVWGWGKMESNQHSIHQETDFGKFKQCPILWASAA